MRLVYRDPVEELSALIEQALRNPRITHIALTKSELRTILSHASVSQVLPRFATSRNNLLRTVTSKMDKVREELSVEGIDDTRKFELFSILDSLEKQKMDIEEKVPTQIAEDGYIVKVALR
jgi:hypothetical protein